MPRRKGAEQARHEFDVNKKKVDRESPFRGSGATMTDPAIAKAQRYARQKTLEHRAAMQAEVEREAARPVSKYRAKKEREASEGDER